MNKILPLNRRQFVASMLAISAASKTGLGFGQDIYRGPYLLRIHAAGGWDLSLYCDPKVNVSGQAAITDWSRDDDIEMAGDIPFAPVSNNADMFSTLHQKMLVINGVDTQTNAHQTGERHTWIGSASEGRPSITALFAAAKAPEQPLSMLNYGGFSASANLVRATRVDAGNLKGVIAPRSEISTSREEELLERYRATGLDLARLQVTESPWASKRLENYRGSHLGKAGLLELHGSIPYDLPSPEGAYKGDSNLKLEIQTSLLAFKAGVAASAECAAGGDWDTHTGGEWSQLSNITALNNGLLYLWELAESLGIANDLIVLVSSDFGRTPYYNSFGGKDHWPINSYLIMANDPIWGGRVVGHTDEAQNASKISPSTLKVSSTGSIIYPKHVHHALHHYLGIDDYARSVGYDFKNTELYDFFNPALTTAGPMPSPFGASDLY